MPDAVVLDASAAVEALIGSEVGLAVRSRLRSCDLHAPAHLDAEVLSAVGRLSRAGEVRSASVAGWLEALAASPIDRHPLAGLLAGAWAAREQLRLVDALYVELRRRLGVPLITTDARLARVVSEVELVTPLR